MLAPALAAVLLAVSAACSTARVPPQPSSSEQRRDLQTAIARLAAAEPDSPATLNARLDYIEYLTNDATGTDCGFRLTSAQSQLDAVAGSRATGVLFPEGWARAADAEYRIHSARASCMPDASGRAGELRAALAAARRAVDLYRGSLDYSSMVVMQFNVSATESSLGEHAAAVAALETALRMDREFGFRDDAQDNYTHLQQLRGGPQDATEVAARMRDFPPTRWVSLSFAWSAADTLVSVHSVREGLVVGGTIESRTQSSLRRTVRPRGDAFVVSYEAAAPYGDAGVWPTAASARDLADAVFPPVLLASPNLLIGHAGELLGVQDVTGFAARLRGEVEGAVRAQAPKGAHAESLLRRGLEYTQEDLTPQTIEAAAAQSYSLDTGMWIGATLQQGVWYETQAALILRGAPNLVVTHRLRFTYARPVPCTAHSPEGSCAELVIRATPDSDALAAAGGARLHYASESETRLIVDPSSLQPYLQETRGYWYVLPPRGAHLDVTLDSERQTWNITPAQSAAAERSSGTR